MLRFYSISSGSSGNAAFVKYKNTKILIDCGISAKRLNQALKELGETNVDAVLITHEHSDHVCGLKVFSKSCSARVYATLPTWNFVNCDNIPVFNRESITPGVPFAVGDIIITPFATCHDCVNPVGYFFICGDKKLALATDNGEITHDFFKNIEGADTALIEANYDIKMLEQGAYPYPLKKRILSPLGHMSNIQAADLALDLAKTGTRRIILGHLSIENNTPELAYDTVYNVLKKENITVSLNVAKRHEITDLLEEKFI